MDEALRKRFEDNPLAKAILREGLTIQDRFVAAPVYGKTGKGSLKSVGITEIEQEKRKSRSTKSGSS